MRRLLLFSLKGIKVLTPGNFPYDLFIRLKTLGKKILCFSLWCKIIPAIHFIIHQRKTFQFINAEGCREPGSVSA